MSSYRLNIYFASGDLPSLYKASQKLVIVKHTEGSDSQVVWAAFNPFENNTIDWGTSYSLYASNTEIQGGATINKLSDITAEPQVNYVFSDAVFQNPAADSELSENTYELTNRMDDSKILTFGLAQDVVVNNEAFANHPINAIYVPFDQTATMTPVEKVDVYLQSNIITSTVVSTITSTPIMVDFTTDTEKTIIYDATTGKFVPKG